VQLAAGATLDLNGASSSSAGLGDVVPGSGGTVTSSAAGNAVLTVNPVGSTNFSGTIQNGAGTVGITKSGMGTQSFSGANTYTGTTTVQGGALAFKGSSAWNPVLSGPNGADVQQGRLIFDYSGGAPNPATQIKTILTASYGTGFASGQIRSSTATSQLGLGWLDDSGSSTVTVAYTYFGDANLDLNVDTVDFNLLAANFSGTGKVWGQGDFNYDGAVDTVDFNLLAANFSKTAPGAQAVGNLGALVPEPGSMMLVVAACGLLQRQRRRRLQA
jgi:autotransporter-associated beta strand protein